LRSVFGEQLQRIVTGADPIDLGPAPGTSRIGERDLVAERGIAYLAAACQMMFREHDPTEPLSLARLALRDADTPCARAADALTAQAAETAAANPPESRAGVHAAMAAQLLLGTPAAS
jgi:hypothetical protein